MANAMTQSTLSAFALDAMHRAKLASASQKHRIENLLGRMIGIMAAIRQLGYPRGEIKHLVEIGLELVPAQVAQFILSPAPTLLLASQQPAQVDLADGLLGSPKAFMLLDLAAGLVDQMGGDVDGPQLAFPPSR
jgi:hypothetical protein